MPELLLRRCRPALGTYVEIGAACEEAGARAAVLAAVEQAFAAIGRVEHAMSFHAPASDLSRINAAGAGSVIPVDRWTAEVLLLAQELHGATGGCFDCGVGGTLQAWGMLPGAPHGRRPAAQAGGGAQHLGIDAGRGEVRLHRPVCLDLGGIAKGFAVDRAIDALAAAGVRCAVVNAGGDLRVLGPVPRPLHVRDPRAPARLRFAGLLCDGAAATSARYFSEMPGRPDRCALVDPFTRCAVADRRSFTVLAPLCAVADGLAKALAVAGALGPSCLQRFGAQGLVL
ncbi:FAD:protein FMN transferase [Xylophilus rhododendri]|uniref:FAD:protein FMN transferase n=1 Tax=Xylophilus rhododendri TaxID=2697032 RepID=A0A857JAR7_9BURK|nr:FAD:protein FMN transferase [Xylophilus rhododendri]QHJ01017.1 FAD:protein FMN transferase [Xylophilus rhododendri]